MKMTFTKEYKEIAPHLYVSTDYYAGSWLMSSIVVDLENIKGLLTETDKYVLDSVNKTVIIKKSKYWNVTKSKLTNDLATVLLERVNN